MTGSREVPSHRRVRRHPERASYERADAHRILDEGLVAHVGFILDDRPFVIPMGYARDGDRLLLHGAAGSRICRRLGSGIPATVAVTLLDGLVLARSAFSHSMNYRSVVVFGRFNAVTDRAEKAAALERLLEHIVPGRSADARAPNARELDATGVLAMPIEDFSVKTRRGPPVDETDDLALPCWAGVLPLTQTPGVPEPDPALGPPREPPAYVAGYRRPDPD